jgi:hypothetical protein
MRVRKYLDTAGVKTSPARANGRAARIALAKDGIWKFWKFAERDLSHQPREKSHGPMDEDRRSPVYDSVDFRRTR